MGIECLDLFGFFRSDRCNAGLSQSRHDDPVTAQIKFFLNVAIRVTADGRTECSREWPKGDERGEFVRGTGEGFNYATDLRDERAVPRGAPAMGRQCIGCRCVQIAPLRVPGLQPQPLRAREETQFVYAK